MLVSQLHQKTAEKTADRTQSNIQQKGQNIRQVNSHVGTHCSISPPLSCLSTRERTGSAGYRRLWTYLEKVSTFGMIFIHVL